MPEEAAWSVATLLYMLHYPPDRERLLERLAKQAATCVVIQSTYEGRVGFITLTLRDLVSGDLAHRLARVLGAVPRAAASMAAPRHLHRSELDALVRAAGFIVLHDARTPWMLGVTRNVLVLQPGRERAALHAPTPCISVVVPARNEARWIGPTLEAIDAASRVLRARFSVSVEVLVVDNRSTDDLRAAVERAAGGLDVRVVPCDQLGAPSARNDGARNARGDVLIFVDADTCIAKDTLERIWVHAHHHGKWTGITGFDPADGGRRARAWWTFWEHVRRLPIPKAKAMPACMFVTRDAFETFGPFDTRVAIGEEWPILARIHWERPERFVYDRAIRARTSSRRMERRPFGYARTFAHYVWAILHSSGRNGYDDAIR